MLPRKGEEKKGRLRSSRIERLKGQKKYTNLFLSLLTFCMQKDVTKMVNGIFIEQIYRIDLQKICELSDL